MQEQRPGIVPQVVPCIVSHNMALGGAQTAILRMIRARPDWVRERTTLYCQSDDVRLLDAAVSRHGFTVGAITAEPPPDPSCWVLSYGNLNGLAERPTSLILHSWDDEGWRYVTRAYGHLRGLTIAAVSDQVLRRYASWIEHGGHRVAGVLPPPVTEWAMCKGIHRGEASVEPIVVAWMGRPIESKGLMSLPDLLALDHRLVIRAWTGADTAASQYTRRTQARTLDALLDRAEKLGVRGRLDLRPLDFDPFAYRHRLEGCHVLLGNSRREGFLMTAAEALSVGVPVVVTRSCGISEFIREGVNGWLIDWDDDPRKLARSAYDAIRRAARLDSIDCLASVRDLALAAGYRDAYGAVLGTITHTGLVNGDARVTVGLRIHKGMAIESLDEAASSLALQTYRRFKTVLLVDGPWEYGQMLARRYNLPLICTGAEPDITHCSWLHRQAVERCDTEFYKPLDYDDQLLPTYLERAVGMLDRTAAHVYGCLLMTLQEGAISPRWWPNKPIETMFTGDSGDNQLPHSSVLMRTETCRAAGNYQERAVGLGADDYHLWARIHRAGGRFVRDDQVRNVVYRIHDKNSLRARKARYGANPVPGRTGGKLVAGAAAASIALLAAPAMGAGSALTPTAQTTGAEDGGSQLQSDLSRPALAPPASSSGPRTMREERTNPAEDGPIAVVTQWFGRQVDAAKTAMKKWGRLADQAAVEKSESQDARKKQTAIAAPAAPLDAILPPQS